MLKTKHWFKMRQFCHMEKGFVEKKTFSNTSRCDRYWRKLTDIEQFKQNKLLWHLFKVKYSFKLVKNHNILKIQWGKKTLVSNMASLLPGVKWWRNPRNLHVCNYELRLGTQVFIPRGALYKTAFILTKRQSYCAGMYHVFWRGGYQVSANLI